ncbi:unnamed protein product [Trifolium pratense]|uniref:Uncharacterized protein n=1 Tax=Trifolium pratense TaxID=57577 RepID=A0ACB0LTY5_TRIPR|nr:unnamed protein product [Trifolium pratense]
MIFNKIMIRLLNFYLSGGNVRNLLNHHIWKNGSTVGFGNQDIEIHSVGVAALDKSKKPEKKDNGNDGSFFDCNICLDLAKDPVVTCCGHLFCWPCLYRWLNLRSSRTRIKECPVCKGEVTDKDVIPIYGGGNNDEVCNEDSSSGASSQIPRRPNARPVSRDPNARPVSRDPNARPVSRDPPNARPVLRDPNARPVSRDSNASSIYSRHVSGDSNASSVYARHVSRDSNASSVDSNARHVLRDSNVRQDSSSGASSQIPRRPNARRVSRDPNARPVSRDPNARPVSRDPPNASPVLRDPNARPVSRDSNASSVDSNARHVLRDSNVRQGLHIYYYYYFQ